MTLKRAAVFAAAAATLQLLFFLVSTFAPYLGNVLLYGPPNDSSQFLLTSSIVLAVVWIIFLFTISRECSGAAMQLPSQKIAFILALLRAGTFLGLDVVSPFLLPYWQPDFRNILGLVLDAGWLTFLIAYTVDPDASRTRTTSLCLAVLVAASGVYSSRAPVEMWLSHPQAAWTGLVQVAAPILEWIADALFLWQFWRTAPAPDPLAS